MTDHFKIRAQRYVSVIARWVIVAAFVFSLTMYIGVYITDNVLAKTYSAKASITVKPTGTLDSTTSGPVATDFQAEFDVLESPDVLQPIITDLGLDKVWAERVLKTSEPLSMEESLHYLEKNLHLNYKRGTNSTEIIVTSDDPKEAAQIANAIAEKYKTLRDAEENQRNNRAQDALRDQIAQQQKVVEAKKSELQNLDDTISGTKSPAPGNQVSSDQKHMEFGDRLNELKAAKSDADAHDKLIKRIATLNDDQIISAFNSGSSFVKPDPDAVKLQSDIEKTESEITNLPSENSVNSLSERIANLQKRLAIEKAQLHAIALAIQQKWKIDLDMAKSRVVLLQKEINDLEKRNPGAVAAYQAAQNDLTQQQSLLDTLNARLKQTIADASVKESLVRIVSRAVAPIDPVKPNRRFCYAITTAIAGLLSVMIASCVEVILLISRAAEEGDRELLPAR
jgi:uncharacterized protein involved in exopolysaccharide biosynthesis